MKSVLVATLVMVVIDLTYGPFAFPQTLEPGGKRDLHPFTLAAVEVTRILGFAAVIWIGVRYVLRAPVSLAEAIWMTLPYAVALVLLLVLVGVFSDLIAPYDPLAQSRDFLQPVGQASSGAPGSSRCWKKATWRLPAALIW